MHHFHFGKVSHLIIHVCHVTDLYERIPAPKSDMFASAVSQRELQEAFAAAVPHMSERLRLMELIGTEKIREMYTQFARLEIEPVKALRAMLKNYSPLSFLDNAMEM